VKEIIAFAVLGLSFIVFCAYLASLEQPMSVSEKLNALQTSVANVTALVQAQSSEIASLKATIESAQADKAQAESDDASLQAEIDKLNAIAPPSAQ